VAFLSDESDVHCVEAAAKPGDAQSAVLWYRPAESKVYRVIYADFSVKELDATTHITGSGEDKSVIASKVNDSTL